MLEGIEDGIGEPVVLPLLVEVSCREIRRELLHVLHVPPAAQDCVVLGHHANSNALRPPVTSCRQLLSRRVPPLVGRFATRFPLLFQVRVERTILLK